VLSEGFLPLLSLVLIQLVGALGQFELRAVPSI